MKVVMMKAMTHADVSEEVLHDVNFAITGLGSNRVERVRIPLHRGAAAAVPLRVSTCRCSKKGRETGS